MLGDMGTTDLADVLGQGIGGSVMDSEGESWTLNSIVPIVAASGEYLDLTLSHESGVQRNAVLQVRPDLERLI